MFVKNYDKSHAAYQELQQETEIAHASSSFYNHI